MKVLKFKEWDGKDLKGDWIFSIKVDGIRMENHSGTILTRGGKPVYNLPKNIKKFEIAEVCCNGNWNDTMSIVTASKSVRRKVKQCEVYTIVPLDARLWLGEWTDPTAEEINVMFNHYHRVHPARYEGLVLYNEAEDLYIKVKDKYTVDVRITGFVESTAKTKGKGFLKEFITDMGKVGTGISKAQCIEFWKDQKSLLGMYIEVEVMGVNKSGKWRHPRFIRLRPDKS